MISAGVGVGGCLKKGYVGLEVGQPGFKPAFVTGLRSDPEQVAFAF